MPTTLSKRTNLVNAWAALRAVAKRLNAAVEDGNAFISSDASAVDSIMGDFESAQQDVLDACTAWLDYNQVTVSGIIYDIVKPDINVNGVIKTAENIQSDGALASALVAAGSDILRPHAPTADFHVNDVTSDTETELQFTDDSTNAPTSWNWSFGDGEGSTEQNPTHQYAEAGTYSVELEVSNAGGSDVKERIAYINISTS